MRGDSSLSHGDLGRPIARGRTAEIYALSNHQVLKLFNHGIPQSSVAYEADIAAKVYATDQACPAVGDLVEVDGRYGLIYERVEGELLMTQLRRSPGKLWPLMRIMAQLHAEIHGKIGTALPSLRTRLRRRIDQAAVLPEDLRSAALARLRELPDSDSLCHGDFHPENILLTPRGPVVIDWNDATRGHPLADVARTVLLGRFAARPRRQPQRWMDGLVRGLMLGAYQSHYRSLAPYDARLLERWLIPVAAARLAENVTEERPYLLQYLATVCKPVQHAG